MRLLREAIRAARENGFVQNEGLAHEVAPASTRRAASRRCPCLLQDSRYGICVGSRWQVRQTRRAVSTPQGTRASARSDEHDRDSGRTPRARDRAQGIAAVSGEIVLETLIDTLMRTAIEQAGAERGLLILSAGLSRGSRRRPTTGGERSSCSCATSPRPLPCCRSRCPLCPGPAVSVILDDAAPSRRLPRILLRERRARSILCLP